MRRHVRFVDGVVERRRNVKTFSIIDSTSPIIISDRTTITTKAFHEAWTLVFFFFAIRIALRHRHASNLSSTESPALRCRRGQFVSWFSGHVGAFFIRDELVDLGDWPPDRKYYRKIDLWLHRSPPLNASLAPLVARVTDTNAASYFSLVDE